MRPVNCKSLIFATVLAGITVAITPSVIAETAGDQTPGPRYGHEMIYDEAREVTVLFGGFGPNGVPQGDTWLWDGEAWRLAAIDGPSPRKWAAAAYDSNREVVVLHGGREGQGRNGSSLGDTWIWDGRKWSQVHADGPTPRDHHRAAYDKVRDRVVLFGGWNGESLEGDTWEWDGFEWKRLARTGPAPRAPFGLSFHDSLGFVVLAGGQNLTRAFADMWAWDGLAWKRLEATVPYSRGFHAMAYSPDSRSVLLFGGRDGDMLLKDLWAWNGDEWSLLSADGPLRRGIYASAYDKRKCEFLVHGSGDQINGEWVLDPRTWAWSASSGWRVVSGGEEQLVTD